MTFSGKEMTAVLKAAKLIAVADGKVAEEERNAIFADLKSFGFAPNSLESTVLEGLADNMEFAEAIVILANMNVEQKKYVCGYMAAVMISDGQIDEKEMAIWRLVSLLTKFPTMTIEEAKVYWQTH